MLKAVLSEVEEKKKDDSREALAKAIAVIDKAASKGVLHKNTASRKISRLTRKVNQLD